MASVNKVILIGNLGQDPEVRHTTNGAAICNLSLATSRSWKNKDSGERQEETEWHRVVLYDRQAEVAGEYLKKGRPVYIEGRLKTRKWTDKDGVEKYTTEIVAMEMTLLGGRDDGNDGGDGRGRGRDDGGSRRPPQRDERTHGERQRERTAGYSDDRGGGVGGGRNPPPQRNAPPQRQAPRSQTGFDDMDDDIPF